MKLENGISQSQKPFYSRFASILCAYHNCLKSNNKEWELKHKDKLTAMINSLPSGSGIDAGTHFDWEKSTPEKLIFYTSFHHMDENGYYDGWTAHSIVVNPSLAFGINITITGRNTNGIKEYLHDVYSEAFQELIVQ